jgi:carbon monoxide dehydrogenase subunit G
MKINNEFTVSVPVQQVWETMLDLDKIAPCLPGAAIQEEKGDGEYAGTMKVKIGPITANYKGTVKFEEADETNHRAVLEATGRDARGQGTASATIVSTLQEQGDKTKVSVETDMKLTGRAAQFGRGIAQDVASKMLGQFADCLERELAGGSGEAAPEAAPVETATSADAGESQQETPSATPVGGGSLGNVVSAAPGTTAAGGTVAGAVVSGAEPSGAAASAPTTSTEQPSTKQQQTPRPEPEAFDIGAVGGQALLKRVGPVLAGLGLLAVVIWLIRR